MRKKRAAKAGGLRKKNFPSPASRKMNKQRRRSTQDSSFEGQVGKHAALAETVGEAEEGRDGRSGRDLSALPLAPAFSYVSLETAKEPALRSDGKCTSLSLA